MSAADDVTSAFAARLAAFLSEAVVKNQSEPPRLKAGESAVMIRGGDFEPPYFDGEMEGTRVDRKHVTVEMYVAVDPDGDPEPALHALRERVIHAFDGDRTLGGRLYGWSNDQDVEPHFEGLEEGECLLLIFQPEHASGGAMSIDYVLHFATDASGHLVVKEGDAAAA